MRPARARPRTLAGPARALRGHASPTSHPVRTARAVMPGPLCRSLPPPALPPAPASSGPRVERAPAAARSARRAGAQLCAATRAGFALSLFLVLGGGGVAAAAVVAGGGGADGRVRRGARGGPGRLQRRVPRQAQGRRARGRQGAALVLRRRARPARVPPGARPAPPHPPPPTSSRSSHTPTTMVRACVDRY